MSVGYSAEHDELRQVVREFLTERSPSREVRRLMEAGESRDDEVWALLTRQLGLSGIAVPARHGGAGYGPVELGIVLEEMGRALLVAPYFSSVVLAGQALAASGDEDAMSRWLPGIADGSLTAALAVAEESGSWDVGDVAATARPAADGWAVSGTKLFVVDGHTADLLLVVARAPDGLGVFCVEREAAGVERARLDTLDLTRALASVVLRDARAARIGAGRDATGWLSEVADLVLAALAAEQLGGAARCLGPLAKVFYSEVNLAMTEFGVALQGVGGMAVEGDARAYADGWWQDAFLYARAYTIAGGANEVLKTVVAERALGLPRDKR